MLLPGDNYSENLMFTLEAYRETWGDARFANLFGEAVDNLARAERISKEDLAQINAYKGIDERVDFALDVFDTGRKALRFSRVAAPLILADGPLPFGDVVFAVALGIDLGVAAYNLVMRDE